MNTLAARRGATAALRNQPTVGPTGPTAAVVAAVAAVAAAGETARPDGFATPFIPTAASVPATV